MDEITEKVLLSVQSFLERLTRSDTLTPEQLTEAHMSSTALGYQLARMRYPAEMRSRLQSEETRLIEALGGHNQMPLPPRKWQDTWQSDVGAQLTSALAATNHASDPEGLARVREFIVAYHSPMDPAVSAGTKATYQGGLGDVRDEDDTPVAIDIDQTRFQSYLDQRDGEKACKVTQIKRLMGGYSKQTYIVDVEKNGESHSIVIRKDGFGLPTGSSVASEYPVLQQVHALGVPTPRPLWLEPLETSPFTTAFMAVERVSGTPAYQIVPENAETRNSWALSIADSLGLLHNGTKKEGVDAREPLIDEINDLQRRIEERERAPHPGLIIGMQWLRDNLSDLAGRPACRIHGDVGFHNFIMQNDRLEGLLDWEFSRYGDPAEDLIPIKSFMDQIDRWDLFKQAYAELCQFTVDDKAARYFNVWREVRNMVACLGSLNSLLLPGVKDVALSVAGTIYIPKYEVAILDAIKEAEEANV